MDKQQSLTICYIPTSKPLVQTSIVPQGNYTLTMLWYSRVISFILLITLGLLNLLFSGPYIFVRYYDWAFYVTTVAFGFLFT